jgi:hypothetical protein
MSPVVGPVVVTIVGNSRRSNILSAISAGGGDVLMLLRTTNCRTATTVSAATGANRRPPLHRRLLRYHHCLHRRQNLGLRRRNRTFLLSPLHNPLRSRVVQTARQVSKRFRSSREVKVIVTATG